MKDKILFVILLIVTITLRLVNLGYSDYISDEPGTFFYRGGKKNPEMSTTEFILSQRKGPLQLAVGFIPYSIVGDYNNELAQRLPFAIFSMASVVIFYFVVKKLTNNPTIAFISSFLLSVNGLIVAYGRIAQYQNLNLFFSLLSLYFFADLLEKDKSYFKSSFLGTLMFSISFYAHWDAVYILIPIIYILVKFFKNKETTTIYKLKLVIWNIVLLLLLLLPFVTPYLNYMFTQSKNVDYAQGILGFANPTHLATDLFQFNLYNPFLTFYLYGIFSFLGIIASKKKSLFSVWFISMLLTFTFLIKYSGLHFYNIFLPVAVLVGYGIYWMLQRARYHKAVILGLGLVFGFLFLQSYLLFVDHKTEYPWQQEKILFIKTQKYTHQDKMKHKTGFPHKRFWKEINTWVNEQNKVNLSAQAGNESFGYFTNEYPQVPKYYMEADFSSAGNLYLIGIKRPQSFATDYTFPQFKGRKTVHKIFDEDGNMVVRIYRYEGATLGFQE